jgi:hypothetical protein
MKTAGKVKEIITDLLKLDMDKIYICEIKEPKSKRSLEQNKLLWKLIHRVAKETYQDDMDVYCGILEKADALSDYVITAIEMEDALRKSFRGVKFIRTQEVNGRECFVYKVYIGSSKMDTKEMTELLNITLDICRELGIEVDYEG